MNMPGSAYVCCLCGEAEFGYGNNPAPLDQMPNRCCDACNYTKVIPARIEMMFAENRGFSSEDSQDEAAAAIIGGIFTVSMGALLEQLAKALNEKDAPAATFFKDCIDYMAMSMVSSYEENTKNFPKEVKYAIDMTLGMTAKQFSEWEQDPSFEELTNLGSSENPDIETMSEVVLDEAKDGYDDDFSVMYSSEDEPDCDHGTTDMSGRCLHCTMTEADRMNEREGGGWEDCPTCGVAIKVGSNSCRNCSEEEEEVFKWGAEARQGDGVKRVCHRDLTMHCNKYSLGWVVCPACNQPYTDEDVVTDDDETDYGRMAESYADFFTQMEELLESTTIAGGWTLDATTDQEDPDAVTMVVKFKPTDPSTFFDIIE